MNSPLPSPRFSQSQPWLIIGLVTVFLAGVATILGVVTPWHVKKTSDSESTLLSPLTYNLARPVNILVMGTDPVLNIPENPGALLQSRSDTLLLVRFDQSAESIHVLSIPRDTQVEIPGVGLGKINEAHYWGGVESAIEVVQKTLNQVPIDRYIRVSSGAFQELVDLLGGVDIFIPQSMSYTDQTQQFNINLSPGWQTLNGTQAEQFARFRSDGQGDMGRIQRQQLLLEAIQKRLKHPSLLPRLPQMIRVMQKYVETNLSFDELLTLGNLSLNLDQNQVKMVILPGEGSDLERDSTSYWYVDEWERDRILHQYFQQHSNRYLLDSLESDFQDPDFPFNLKIAIQNASGSPQAGEQVLDYLASQGFYNVYLVSDWLDRQRHTQIIVQQGDLKSAEFLQNLLEIGTIKSISTGEMSSELTLRIGKDWSQIIRP